MQAVAEAPTRKPRGRTDKAGQETVIKLEPLKEKVSHLVSLYREAEEASATCSEGIKAIAEQSGLLATVVRKYIAARAGDKLSSRRRETEQLSLCFEELAGS